MRTLSKTEYEEILQGGDAIERYDEHGVKVLRRADGLFLKTFRYRRRISSRRIYPEWLRFTLHAKSLARRAIPTITVQEAIRIPYLNLTGVIYRPLAGRTLRQVASSGEFDGALAGRLGAFMARLHRQGIHFRSLHLGNVVLCPDGALGLIDISDMKTFLWPLAAGTRRRNFTHLFRYKEDVEILTEAGVSEFLSGYLKENACKRLEKGVADVLRHHTHKGA